MFEQGFLEREAGGMLQGLTDSKKLSEARRRHFFHILTRCPHATIGIGIASSTEIDTLNILRATHVAMARAISNLPALPEHVLVDGLPVKGLPCPSTAIIGGDAKSLSISAASVIAKVIRDSQMKELGVIYPVYGFARHKGYGSAAHMQALMEHGPSPVHRMSFRPVREAAEILTRSTKHQNTRTPRD
jgi:ribonuclease HII